MSFEELVLGIIAITISVAAVVVSVLLSRKTLEKSEQIAKEYGDVAGTKAAIQHEEEKAARARIAALRALLYEVARLQELADHNSQLQPHESYPSPVRMPVTALETAFLSGESILLGEWEEDAHFLSVVTSYLTKAQSINSRIDFFLTLPGSLGTDRVAGQAMVIVIEQIVDESTRLTEILGQLGEHLHQKLSALSCQIPSSTKRLPS